MSDFFSQSEMLQLRMQDAVGNNDLQDLKKCISEGANPKDNHSFALTNSIMNHYFECAKFLIPLSDVNANDADALCWSVSEGSYELFSLLYPLTDMSLVAKRVKREGDALGLPLKAFEERYKLEMKNLSKISESPKGKTKTL